MVKNKISHREGLPPDLFRLVSCDEKFEIKDRSRSCADFGIQNLSTLFITLRLSGGGGIDPSQIPHQFETILTVRVFIVGSWKTIIMNFHPMDTIMRLKTQLQALGYVTCVTDRMKVSCYGNCNLQVGGKLPDRTFIGKCYGPPHVMQSHERQWFKKGSSKKRCECVKSYGPYDMTNKRLATLEILV